MTFKEELEKALLKPIDPKKIGVVHPKPYVQLKAMPMQDKVQISPNARKLLDRQNKNT